MRSILLLALSCTPQQSPAPTTTGPERAPATTAAPGGGGGAPTISLGLRVEGFSRPLLVTHAGDGSGRIFVVEQTGKIKVVNPKTGAVDATPFYDASSLLGSAGGEQGLLGLAFHPKFKENGRLFIGYTDREENDAYAELRTTADRSRVDASTHKVLFAIDDFAGNHNGGHVAFGPDGLLYLGTGDGGGGGDPKRTSQDDKSLLGKMLRLDVDKPNAKPEIFSKGLRNPWRYSFDRATGDLWIADVGQYEWEWVHYVPKAELKPGLNFGWSVIEGSHCFNDKQCDPSKWRAPVFEYRHSAEDGCSITGGYVYRGKAIPNLVGAYLVGDYCSGRVWIGSRASPSSKLVFTKALETKFAISSFGEDEDGEIWICDHGGGAVRKLTK